MQEIYNFMDKYKNVNLGQIFTPPHMALFAAKIIGINSEDVVLDTCAGTGALLFAALEQGAKKVLGVELDSGVFKTLEQNLENVNSEIINDSMLNDTAIEWIKSKPITKCIINPPYETKWKTYDILKNTLSALQPRTLVALFYPSKKLDKSSKRWKKWFLENNTLEKVIKMPKNLFSPYVSVETSLFIIRAGIPQNGKEFFACNIEDDGLVTIKKQYAQDSKGKWKNELEPYWYRVVTEEAGDETAKFISPDDRLSYKEPEKPFELFESDFRKTAFDYVCFQKGINTKELREKIADAVCYQNHKIIPNESYVLMQYLLSHLVLKMPSKEDGTPDEELFKKTIADIQDEKERLDFIGSLISFQ